MGLTQKGKCLILSVFLVQILSIFDCSLLSHEFDIKSFLFMQFFGERQEYANCLIWIKDIHWHETSLLSSTFSSWLYKSIQACFDETHIFFKIQINYLISILYFFMDKLLGIKCFRVLVNKQVWIIQNWSTGGVKDLFSLKCLSSILTRLFFFINWRGCLGLLIWNKAYKELLTKQMCELLWIQVPSNQEIVELLIGYKQIK